MFLFSILLVSALIFIISFLLHTLHLISSFSSFLKWKLRLLLLGLSSFLTYIFNAISFPLSTVFAASCKF